MSTPPRSSTGASPRLLARERRRPGVLSAASLLVLGLAPLQPLTGTGHAAVTLGSNISVFPDRDMVVAVGYEPGEQLLVEAVRDGVVIGTTQGPAVETPEGTGLEVNHGPLGTPLPGDCWTHFTPDIVGGDVIRVTPVERPDAVADTMTVADIAFTGGPVLEADGSVSVSGTATPGTDFAVEFRRDKPDPRFRRGPFVPVFTPGTNTWKATFRPTATSAEGPTAEQQREIALDDASWLAVADDITETTLAELGEPGGVGPGCTGSADPNSLVGGLEPISIASPDVTFSGTARAGVAAVTVTVGALGARQAVLTPAHAVTGPSTWALTVPKADLLTLPDGNVTVTPRFDGSAGTARNVLKDTTAPLAPSATPTAGTYARTQDVALLKPDGEGTSTVHWTIGGADVPDPDQSSERYSSQIAVSATQTIKARVIDAVGNPGAVASFTYRIGSPPAAPTGVSATAGNASSTVRWTAPTDTGGAAITGYRVRAYSGTRTVAVSTTTVGDVRTANVTGLTNGTAYTFDVAATNSVDTGAVSARSAAVTPRSEFLAPTISSRSPALHSTAVAQAANVVVTFSEPVTGVGASTVQLLRGTTVQAATVSYDATRRQATLNPFGTSPSVLAADAVHTVRVNAGVRDVAGNALPTSSWSFTTGPRPAVTGVSPPASTAVLYRRGINVDVAFSENVTGWGANNVVLERRSPSGAYVAVPGAHTWSYNATTRKGTLNPYGASTARLAASSTFRVRLLTGLRDAARNPLPAYSWTFRTGTAS